MVTTKRKNEPRHVWTSEEETYFSASYPTMRTDQLAEQLGLRPSQLHDKAAALGIKKSQEWMKEHLLECARRARRSPAWKGFNSGNRPWNKGIRFVVGGASALHRYKPKSLPHNRKPIGSERRVDGFLQRKMTATGYPPRDWVPVHHLVWEQSGRGKVPKDMVLFFKDGNRDNFSLDNFELITRVELMRRNSIQRYGPEIARLAQLKGALTRQIRRKLGNEE